MAQPTHRRPWKEGDMDQAKTLPLDNESQTHSTASAVPNTLIARIQGLTIQTPPLKLKSISSFNFPKYEDIDIIPRAPAHRKRRWDCLLSFLVIIIVGSVVGGVVGGAIVNKRLKAEIYHDPNDDGSDVGVSVTTNLPQATHAEETCSSNLTTRTNPPPITVSVTHHQHGHQHKSQSGVPG